MRILKPQHLSPRGRAFRRNIQSSAIQWKERTNEKTSSIVLYFFVSFFSSFSSWGRKQKYPFRWKTQKMKWSKLKMRSRPELHHSSFFLSLVLKFHLFHVNLDFFHSSLSVCCCTMQHKKVMGMYSRKWCRKVGDWGYVEVKLRYFPCSYEQNFSSYGQKLADFKNSQFIFRDITSQPSMFIFFLIISHSFVILFDDSEDIFHDSMFNYRQQS